MHLRHFAGIDIFTYQLADGETTSTAQIKVVITNHAPVANDLSYNMHVAGDFWISPLEGASDPDGHSLHLVGFTQTQNAWIEQHDDELMIRANAVGSFSINYTVTDGYQQTTGTITVNVTNAAPVAQSDTITIGLGERWIDLRSYASDPDGDWLNFSKISGPGLLYYDNLQVNFQTEGMRTFVLNANDGYASAQFTLTVNVLDSKPVAVNDTYSGGSSGQYMELLVLANDTDADGDPLTIKTYTTPTEGSIQFYSNKLIWWPPRYNIWQPVTFTYTVTDGRWTSTATVTINP